MDYASAQKILAKRNGFRQSLKRDISHATEIIKIHRELVDKDEAELNILMKKSNKKKSNKKSQDKIRAVLASLHVHKSQVKFHKQEIKVCSYVYNLDIGNSARCLHKMKELAHESIEKALLCYEVAPMFNCHTITSHRITNVCSHTSTEKEMAYKEYCDSIMRIVDKCELVFDIVNNIVLAKEIREAKKNMKNRTKNSTLIELD